MQYVVAKLMFREQEGRQTGKSFTLCSARETDMEEIIYKRRCAREGTRNDQIRRVIIFCAKNVKCSFRAKMIEYVPLEA